MPVHEEASGRIVGPSSILIILQGEWPAARARWEAERGPAG